MSQLKLSGDASGTGIVTVAAPNTNSTYTVTLPAAAGTLARTDAAQTFTGVQTFSSDASVNGITVGRGAGAVATNTAVGASALTANTNGSANTAVGYQALYSNITGATNTAFGHRAGYYVTNSDNTLVGNDAGRTITTGAQNTALGSYVMNNSVGVTGSENVGIGRAVLSALTSGSYNIAIGNGALVSNTTASNNTAVGYQALYSNTASGNVAVGYQAGYNVTTGTQNTFLGTGAGQGVNPGYAVCLGRASGAGLAGNYTLYIANDNVGAGNAACWIYGNSSGACYQGNNSSSWSTTSDARLKNVLGDSTKGLAEIMQVEVKNFKYKSKEELPDFVFNEQGNAVVAPDSENVYTGPIAQQVVAPFPESVKTGEMGVLTVDSDPIFWAMLNAIKELKVELDSVKAELAALKA